MSSRFSSNTEAKMISTFRPLTLMVFLLLITGLINSDINGVVDDNPHGI